MENKHSTVEGWLVEFKRADLVGVAPDLDAADPLIREVETQRPDHSPEEARTRGYARQICLAHPFAAQGAPAIQQPGLPAVCAAAPAALPQAASSDPKRTHWRWIDAAILAALLLLFGARVAHCQAFGPLYFQSNGTPIKTVAATATINFTGGGTPCSASGNTITCNFASGSSGVTSVGLSMPSQFTVSGSPVTSSGTLTAAWATENANLVFGGPSSGAAATPTFRALVAADLPSTAVTSVVNDTNVTGTISAQALTLGWTGTLAVSRGGTGAATTSQNYVFAGPSGASGAPSFRLLVGADLPNPSATTLGGVESIAAASHEWVNSISTLGVPSLSQPAFSDVSGSVACAQLPALTGDATSTAGTCATTVAKVNGAAVPASALVLGSNSSSQLTAFSPPWVCNGAGLGDGLNAMAAGTYLQTNCYNGTGQTVTITGIKCYVDNASATSTMNVTNGAGTDLLTGAVTCSNAFASGTQSSTVTLAAGDYLKFTFVADGTSKQTSWVVEGTY